MSYSDRHYGAGDPACPVCHGIGYISYDVPEDHAFFGKVFDCQCHQEYLADERQAHIRRLSGLEYLGDKTFETFNSNRPGLDSSFHGELQRMLERVRAYAEEPQGWLFISGGHGCGKTHLAAAAANRQIERGKGVLFVTTPDLLDYLRAAYTPDGNGEGDSYESRFEEIRTAPFLVLDNLGIENATPWAVEKLYQILNFRYVAHLPTIITSNYRVEGLEPSLRSQLSDLDFTQILIMTAPDYRHSGMAVAQTELGGLGPYRDMTFSSFKLRSDLLKTEQESLKRALKIALQYADQPKGWLAFIGTYNAGKTHLAASIVNTTVLRGVPALFITVSDLLQHLRAKFGPDSNISHDKLFNDVRTAPLLVLDDLGAEWSTAWAKEKLNQLLNFRYASNLPTVITSPLALEDIEKEYPRLVAHMRDKRISHVQVLTVRPYLGEAEPRQR